jgi:hypothetical protein
LKRVLVERPPCKLLAGLLDEVERNLSRRNLSRTSQALMKSQSLKFDEKAIHWALVGTIQARTPQHKLKKLCGILVGLLSTHGDLQGQGHQTLSRANR